MSKVIINERITVDEPQCVETAIFNFTGQQVEFEIIRKFIVNEKDTMYYVDRKLNSFTDPGCYSDYLWLDTGFRDRYDNPIMICLRNGFGGFTGHYTAPVRQLADHIKSANKRNNREIDANFSRFMNKYKARAAKRNIVTICDPMGYAVAIANRESMNSQDTAMARALQTAGVEIAEVVVEAAPVEVENVQPDTLAKKQEEITIGFLLEQIDKMQGTIDDLLARMENNERTSQDELATLRAQNEEYKRALVRIRLYNEENNQEKQPSLEEQYNGHNLLGHNEKILILGNTDIRTAEMKAIACNDFGFDKNDFEFITDYEKVKSAAGRIHNSDRFAAVIFGNCPHKVAGLGSFSSIIEEYKQRGDCLISIDARTQSGELKITKQSFREAMKAVYLELREKQVA